MVKYYPLKKTKRIKKDHKNFLKYQKKIRRLKNKKFKKKLKSRGFTFKKSKFNPRKSYEKYRFNAENPNPNLTN